MLFDTHAHVNDPAFDEDREALLERVRRGLEGYGLRSESMRAL